MRARALFGRPWLIGGTYGVRVARRAPRCSLALAQLYRGFTDYQPKVKGKKSVREKNVCGHVQEMLAATSCL